MKRPYKFLIAGCLIIIAGSFFLEPFFRFSVRKNIEKIDHHTPYCLLVAESNKNHHWTDLRPVTIENIHFFRIISLHISHPQIYETPPHILLITENKSYLWSMKKWQFVAYKPESAYVDLDVINNKEFVKECK